MTDPNDIDVDDLVTEDDLEELRDAIESMAGDDGGSDEPTESEAGAFDPDDAPFVDDEEAASIADRTLLDRLEHLAGETCDTPECERLRDEFGLNPGEGEDGDHDHDHDDEDTAESDEESGNGESTDDEDPESESPEGESPSDDSDSDGSDSDDGGLENYAFNNVE